MAPNPFLYGTVVTGKNFVGRSIELKLLQKELTVGKSLILYSERRLGKTSLLMEFIARKRRNIIPVYIDLYGMTTKEDLGKQIVNKVINNAYTKIEKIKGSVKNFLKSLKPKLILSPDGNVTIDVTVEKKFGEDEFVEILDFPQKVAEEKKVRIIMIFDEFQEISLMDGVALEKQMRARFQHHKNVSYVFSGSREHMLKQIFEEQTRAFYKFARPMKLGPIPAEDFRPFISLKFKRTGGKASDEIIDNILDYTGGNPYLTQYLCHEVWYITKNPKWKEVIDAAVENIVAQQSIGYEHIWDELKSRHQRSLLIAIANEGKPSYSSEFIEKYRLKSQSNVEKSLKMLKNRRILDEEGRLKDIFFKEWLIRRISKY
ncbi:MAG: ATP-binding protein [Thermoplasmata archaeon]|nr:MAG: ATP-binding protein [Thermoplasmata archaeon]